VNHHPYIIVKEKGNKIDSKNHADVSKQFTSCIWKTHAFGKKNGASLNKGTSCLCV